MAKLTPRKRVKRGAIAEVFPLLEDVFQLLEKDPRTKPYASAARAAAWLYLKHVDNTSRKPRKKARKNTRARAPRVVVVRSPPPELND